MTRTITVCYYCGCEVGTASCPCRPGFVPVTVRAELVPAFEILEPRPTWTPADEERWQAQRDAERARIAGRR